MAKKHTDYLIGKNVKPDTKATVLVVDFGGSIHNLLFDDPKEVLETIEEQLFGPDAEHFQNWCDGARMVTITVRVINSSELAGLSPMESGEVFG